MNPTEQAYRRTAAEGATGFGLLIALYDALAADLRRAAEAQRRGDIEQRSKEAQQALLVIVYLDDWIDRKEGGELADKLIAFYANLRTALIEAEVRQSPEFLDGQMAIVIAIRGSWHDIELRAASALEVIAVQQDQAYPGSKPAQPE